MSANGPDDVTESGKLLEQIARGDEQAAQELFDRFLHRLIGLARQQLSAKMRRRTGPEDVVQSAFRSFFVHARRGDYGVQSSGELWRLLAAITVNKVRYHVRKNQANKRDVRAETDVSSDSLLGINPEALTSEPSADESLVLADQLREVMSDRSPRQQQIILLLLKGRSDKEIASEIKCSIRTVQRTKGDFRKQLEEKLADTTSWERKKTDG